MSVLYMFMYCINYGRGTLHHTFHGAGPDGDQEAGLQAGAAPGDEGLEGGPRSWSQKTGKHGRGRRLFHTSGWPERKQKLGFILQ